MVDLDRALTVEEIKSLDREFGELMPEQDDAIASFTGGGYSSFPTGPPCDISGHRNDPETA
jgi:hypothetical protein